MSKQKITIFFSTMWWNKQIDRRPDFLNYETQWNTTEKSVFSTSKSLRNNIFLWSSLCFLQGRCAVSLLTTVWIDLQAHWHSARRNTLWTTSESCSEAALLETQTGALAWCCLQVINSDRCVVCILELSGVPVQFFFITTENVWCMFLRRENSLPVHRLNRLDKNDP